MKARVPTSPEPPARLSTTTCWPSAPVSFSATTRAMASTPPPGGYGTTSVMVFDGKSWADAPEMPSGADAPLQTQSATATAAAARHQLCTILSPLRYRWRIVPPPLGTAAGPQRRATRMRSDRVSAQNCSATARFRPSPATCDASIPRSADRRSTDAPGLRRFRLPTPGASAPVPQDALLGTFWGVLLKSDCYLTGTVYTLAPFFEAGFDCAMQQSPGCVTVPHPRWLERKRANSDNFDPFAAVAMTREEERELREQLARLQQEHRDLDAAISALQHSPGADLLQVQRLKKRKLYLRDRIAHIEDELTPDII